MRGAESNAFVNFYLYAVSLAFTLDTLCPSRIAVKDAAPLVADVLEALDAEPPIAGLTVEESARLVLTIAGRESGGNGRALGKLGDCGAMQVKGPFLFGHPCKEVLENRVLGLRLGIRALGALTDTCGDVESAVSAYATGKCNSGIGHLIARSRMKQAGL